FYTSVVRAICLRRRLHHRDRRSRRFLDTEQLRKAGSCEPNLVVNFAVFTRFIPALNLARLRPGLRLRLGPWLGRANLDNGSRRDLARSGDRLTRINFGFLFVAFFFLVDDASFAFGVAHLPPDTKALAQRPDDPGLLFTR